MLIIIANLVLSAVAVSSQTLYQTKLIIPLSLATVTLHCASVSDGIFRLLFQCISILAVAAIHYGVATILGLANGDCVRLQDPHDPVRAHPRLLPEDQAAGQVSPADGGRPESQRATGGP